MTLESKPNYEKVSIPHGRDEPLAQDIPLDASTNEEYMNTDRNTRSGRSMQISPGLRNLLSFDNKNNKTFETIPAEEEMIPTEHSSQSEPSSNEEDDEGTERSRGSKCSRTCLNIQNFFSFDNNKDAKGCAFVKIPEAASWIASSIYLSTLLVKYAYIEAGCSIDIPEGETELPECLNRVYGFKPSSMLSIFLLILGIVTAIFLPLVGAMMDLSNRRRAVGAVTGFILCAITFAQSFVSQRIWFPVCALQILGSAVLILNGCVVLAYLPELTNDEMKLARYNTLTQIFFNVTVVIYLIILTIVSSFLNTSDNELETAKIALRTTFVIQVLFYGISWLGLFSPREARKGNRLTNRDFSDLGDASEGGAGRCGFVRDSLQSVRDAIIKAFKQRSEVRYFLVYRALTFPANAAMMAAVVSYVNEQIRISSRDLGIATLIILASAIPGSKLSLILMRKTDPLRSLKLCMLFTAALPPSIVLMVSRPGHEWRLFLISIAWGLIIGWKEPSDKTTLCSLIPPGVEAEMMGLYMGCGQILMWMSPLFFTLMNESGLNLRVAIASFAVYPLLGFISLLLMGTYSDVARGTKIVEEA